MGAGVELLTKLLHRLSRVSQCECVSFVRSGFEVGILSFPLLFALVVGIEAEHSESSHTISPVPVNHSGCVTRVHVGMCRLCEQPRDGCVRLASHGAKLNLHKGAESI